MLFCDYELIDLFSPAEKLSLSAILWLHYYHSYVSHDDDDQASDQVPDDYIEVSYHAYADNDYYDDAIDLLEL